MNRFKKWLKAVGEKLREGVAGPVLQPAFHGWM